MKKQNQKGFNRIVRVLSLITISASVFSSGVTFQNASAAIENVVKLARTSEPPNLDSTKATDAESFFYLGHVMEGLSRYDVNGKIVPGVAEKWEVNDKTAKFTLRKDAKWSDGKTVTAKDFVFAWQVAVDPKTASDYAFILYPVKNGEAINQGKMPTDQLGVKAVNDTTLEITFEKPCGYFLSLTTFPTYYPIRKDFYDAQAGKYAAEASTMLYNGPYVMTSWVHGASLKMDRNKNYWNSAKVSIDAIDIPYITPDDNARFNLYKDKKVDMVGLTKETLPTAQKANMKLKKYADGTMFYMRYNFRDGHPTKNLNLRKAIQAIYNPDEYIRTVIGIPGTLPASGIVPGWMSGVKSTFRKDFPIAQVKRNTAEAKKFVEAAKKELGGNIPPIVWLTGDSPNAAKEAEYFQNLFKKELGLELKIDKQIFKQRLAKSRAGDFDIESAGWGPDYADPMTFVDLHTSWNDNNSGLFVDAKYDEWVKKALASSDQTVRMNAMAEAEKIAMEKLPIQPLFERTVMYTESDRLSGVTRRAVGFDPDFTNAKIVK